MKSTLWRALFFIAYFERSAAVNRWFLGPKLPLGFLFLDVALPLTAQCPAFGVLGSKNNTVNLTPVQSTHTHYTGF